MTNMKYMMKNFALSTCLYTHTCMYIVLILYFVGLYYLLMVKKNKYHLFVKDRSKIHLKNIIVGILISVEQTKYTRSHLF